MVVIETDLDEHREAWKTVMGVVPGSELVSHGPNYSGEWEQVEVHFPSPPQCETCGEPRDVVSLTVKCRDWHEVCRDCGVSFSKPKGKGCRRRKHPKKEDA